MAVLDSVDAKLIRVAAEADLSGLVVSGNTFVFAVAEGSFWYMNGLTPVAVSQGASTPGTTPSANLADLAVIAGGEDPTEAEHNLVVVKVNAILDVLEEQGLMNGA